MGVSARSLPPSSFATGSGVINMIRQAAIAVGVAIFVAVIAAPASPERADHRVPSRLVDHGGGHLARSDPDISFHPQTAAIALKIRQLGNKAALPLPFFSRGCDSGVSNARDRMSHAAPFPSAPSHTETSIEPASFRQRQNHRWGCDFSRLASPARMKAFALVRKRHAGGIHAFDCELSCDHEPRAGDGPCRTRNGRGSRCDARPSMPSPSIPMARASLRNHPPRSAVRRQHAGGERFPADARSVVAAGRGRGAANG